MVVGSTPNEIILNDNLRKHTYMLEKLTVFLDAAYLQIQEDESEKVPRRLRPLTVNVQCPTSPTPIPFQVLPRNMARHDVAIYNIGPSDILWSNSWFDPTSILQQFSDPANPDTVLPAPNQIVQIGYLPSGGSMDITATEAIWVYNVTSNAVLTINESVFAIAGKRSGPMPPVGLDGAIGAGYNQVDDPDGNPTFVKGLR